MIDASGIYTITISTADVAQSLTINDTGATVMDESGGSLTLGGALTVDAGVFEFAGGTLAGVNALTIGTGGVIDAADPNLASVIDTGNPVLNDGTLEASGGGDLVIRDPLDNDGGIISIQDGTVELAVSNSLTVNFSGTGGTLQLDNTVTGGASAGVDATSTGTAAIIITGIGSVSSTGAAGIEATSAGGDISVTPEGSVTGTIGVDVTQDGNGNITITVGGPAGTTITGTAYYGILGLSLGSGEVSVSTSGADTIDSTSSGIVAENQAATIASSAGSSITVTAYGTIDSGSQLSELGNAPDGIVAGYLPNAEGEPDANVNGSVTVNNFANITAAGGSSGGAGIDAFNFGNGDVTVNDNYGAGAVASTSVSGVQYGIEAIADSGGTGNVTVNIGTDATLSTSTGSSGLFGVDAFSTDTGNITVTMSTGDSVTSGSAGIVAVNWAAAAPTSSAITVTAEGTINSGANLQDGNPPAGILAGYNPDNSDASDPSVAGSVSVTSDATITAVAGFGIWAFTFGTGNITVSTSAQSVITSGSAGIVAVNLATTDPASSAIAVTTDGIIDLGPNTQDGGFPSAGILAGYNPNNAGTLDSDVAGNVGVTSDATINAAGGYGISAFNFGTGNVAVTTEADSSITASGSAIDTPDGVIPPIGIGADAFDGGNASISNDGTVAASAGITLLANATGGLGTGTATITNDGTVSGDGTSANPVVAITAGAATLTNAGTIEAPSASGLAIAESGTITLNNSGTIIGEVALGEATFNIQSGGIWDVSGPSSFNTGSTINDAGTINAIGNTDITSADITLNFGSATSTGYLWNDDLTNNGAILTLDAGLTIDQTGNAAIYSTNATTAINDSVVSYATINASAAYTFYIQPDFFTNYGQIDADLSGGTLDIIPTGSFTNYGTVAVSNGENATIENGSISSSQPEDITNELGGVISVAAGSSITVNGGSFTNDGTLWRSTAPRRSISTTAMSKTSAA